MKKIVLTAIALIAMAATGSHVDSAAPVVSDNQPVVMEAAMPELPPMLIGDIDDDDDMIIDMEHAFNI